LPTHAFPPRAATAAALPELPAAAAAAKTGVLAWSVSLSHVYLAVDI